MLTHTLVDQYGSESPACKLLRYAIAGSVQFDCGSIDLIPIGKGALFCESRAPYKNTLLQFEMPSNPVLSHAILILRYLPDDSTEIIAAQRLRRNKEWRTALPTIVKRGSDGSFNYYRNSNNAEITKFVTVFHAQALNFFYILGCTNVETADHPAPTALNKKRTKAGKFPMLEYKTLVLKLDTQSAIGQSLGGTHASPRLHLRRGHVRHLESGKRVWVRECVVGSAHGIVLKDYRITNATPHNTI